ncbi:MBL fold metallo-hydrolase [uncultured Williamsia sp.]|uniref:MBL fold metallo-hydrolase n=1 Tax=uncultured Williamsia sp. TaxID=259311 RepID=UPI00261550A3|nr:MBL fold metallo-hydrolase [uncultured Williamsia sp.]
MSDDDASDAISDRITRIPLPLPLAELRSVNCYAIASTSGTTLIDPGWASPETRDALSRGLSQIGTSIDEVSQILVTHSHWDHYSAAFAMSTRRDIPLAVGSGERHSIAAWVELDGAFPNQVTLLERAGDPIRAREMYERPIAEFEQGIAYGDPTRYLDGGEGIDCGGVCLDVIATPGHTRGHLAFEDADGRFLFSGDHILPRITPSIAYERAPDRLALQSYLSSLRLIADRPRTTLLPAHGAPGGSSGDRALELIDHHRRRLATVAELVDDGCRTGLDIARGMRWTRREQTLDQLADDQQWTAVLEAVAHAEVLVDEGRLRRENDRSIDRYLPAAS